MKNKIISYILKTVVVISAVLGVIFSVLNSGAAFMYFTIQSNIAIALVALVGAILMLKDIDNRIWQVIKLVATVAITLTGVVFCFVLAPTLGNGAWSVRNILTHVVVPLAAVIDFFIPIYKAEYKKADSIYIIIPPLLYAIYAGICYGQNLDFGAGVNYPYFFLNWGSPAGAFGFTDSLPFMGCAYWILALLLFLIAVGLGYIKLSKVLTKKL